MLLDNLFITDQLRSRSTRLEQLDDHLLADIGLTRADVIKQKRWFGRKSKRG